MLLSALGIADYESYKRSVYFARLRSRVGIGRNKCAVCHKKTVRIPHHLCYLCLGEEKPECVVGLCFDCNRLAHFYANGKKVPVTRDGYFLKKRYREITSVWYPIRQWRPSHILQTLWDWYRV